MTASMLRVTSNSIVIAAMTAVGTTGTTATATIETMAAITQADSRRLYR